jgi:hypothetical protein
LVRGKQSDTLKSFCESRYPEAKNELANVFLQRCLELSFPDGAGVIQVVMPQNWLFLTSYGRQRKSLLRDVTWNLIARLGMAAFEIMDWWAFNIILITQTNKVPADNFVLRVIDADVVKATEQKAKLLRHGDIAEAVQGSQLRNPGSIISLAALSATTMLSRYTGCFQGTSTGDNLRFLRTFWEAASLTGLNLFQGPSEVPQEYSGREHVIDWDDLTQFNGAAIRGEAAWGRKGVAIGQMRNLPATLYTGSRFSNSTPVIIPKSEEHLAAIWCFCNSQEFLASLREINQKLSVDNGYVGKIAFDLARWQEIASEEFPNGLPKPYSNDPTQWLFHGHPNVATKELQVAVARLTGYRWPAETDGGMELAEDARTWIARCEKLSARTDDDGIVCLSSVRGEQPADVRLLALLIDAWETVEPGSWKPAILDRLLADVDCAGKSLDVWLRDSFFEQHAKIFHNRPFIWHIWDGLKDGFGALVNYHKLDTKNLERLIHTYLGDWIRQQEEGIRKSLDGAVLRLSAAQNLKVRLEWVLAGEAPYDIFVRWKPLDQQPIGWNPDLNDGVRLNIRPFMTAEVLRHNKKPKLNITWDKDRGKDVESAPWFKVFAAERINDHHLTLAEKRAARGLS